MKTNSQPYSHAQRAFRITNRLTVESSTVLLLSSHLADSRGFQADGKEISRLDRSEEVSGGHIHSWRGRRVLLATRCTVCFHTPPGRAWIRECLPWRRGAYLPDFLA